jgi:UDP-glucose 4-epimerase
MRVVVLGASGNAGTALLRELGSEPRVTEVIGVARRPGAVPMPKVEWRVADVARDELAGLFESADAVVHLAWLIQPSRDEAAMRAVNVDGSRRVFEAVVAAGVPTLVYASSVGAYAPGPKDRAVDESWPVDGIESSFYARHKSEVEDLLDGVEREHPELRVVRIRPGLVFRREAATGIRRLFLGPLVPNRLIDPRFIPVVPDLPRLRFQAVHGDDLAAAYRLAIVGDARGPFNVAADPVLDPGRLAELLRARPVRMPARALRTAAAVGWRVRLLPTPAGWFDLALAVPVMDCSRARRELGWAPRRRSTAALGELIEGLRAGAGFPTPPLDPKTSGPMRQAEFRTGVGARST